MEICEMSFRSWMLIGLYVFSVMSISDFIAKWLIPKLVRWFRRKKIVDPPCPMIGCHNTSCDHYLSQYDVCRCYIDVYGVDKFYELISGKASDQEVTGYANK